MNGLEFKKRYASHPDLAAYELEGIPSGCCFLRRAMGHGDMMISYLIACKDESHSVSSVPVVWRETMSEEEKLRETRDSETKLLEHYSKLQ